MFSEIDLNVPGTFYEFEKFATKIEKIHSQLFPWIWSVIKEKATNSTVAFTAAIFLPFPIVSLLPGNGVSAAAPSFVVAGTLFSSLQFLDAVENPCGANFVATESGKIFWGKNRSFISTYLFDKKK